MTTKPADYDALVERLLELAKAAERGKHYGFEQTVWQEAADAIRDLRAERDALRERLRITEDALCDGDLLCEDAQVIVIANKPFLAAQEKEP